MPYGEALVFLNDTMPIGKLAQILNVTSQDIRDLYDNACEIFKETEGIL